MISIDGVSLLDNNSGLANAGILYVMFKDWSVRGKSEGLLPLYTKLNQIAVNTLNAKVLVVPPPPIQGLGMSGGFQMQVELQDGTFDYRKLQQATDQMVSQANHQPELQRRNDFLSCGCSAGGRAH